MNGVPLSIASLCLLFQRVCPVVGIEAQTADLPCIFSDSITREVDISPFYLFLESKTVTEIWAEKALQLIREKGVRQDRSQEITQAGF